MTQVALFGAGQKSKSSMVSSQRRINLYGEIPRDPERAQFVLYPTPGLSLWATLGGAAIRGWQEIGDYLYIAHQDRLYRADTAGAFTELGSLSTSSGKVSMAHNGTYLLVVDGTTGYTYNTGSGTFAEIADSDFPDGATTATYQDGLFIVDAGPTSQRFYISAQNDPTSWDALDFAAADSNPDYVVRVMADHGELIVFGQYSTEFWGYTGATDFPYARLTSVEWGLAARWSLAKFQSSLMFLGQNRMGQVQVVILNGYTPAPVSTPDEDALFNAYTVRSDAVARSFQFDGHPFYQIAFQSDAKSWLYDGLTKLWSEVKSDGTRHRGELGIVFNTKQYVSSWEDGRIYELTGESYTDDGTNVTRQVVTRHFLKDGEYFSVDELWADMEVGVGSATGQGADPQVMLRCSRDGGNSYGSELWRDLGGAGEYKTRVRWQKPTGVCRDFVAEFTVTDPVKVVFLGGFMRIS